MTAIRTARPRETRRYKSRSTRETRRRIEGTGDEPACFSRGRCFIFRDIRSFSASPLADSRRPKLRNQKYESLYNSVALTARGTRAKETRRNTARVMYRKTDGLSLSLSLFVFLCFSLDKARGTRRMLPCKSRSSVARHKFPFGDRGTRFAGTSPPLANVPAFGYYLSDGTPRSRGFTHVAPFVSGHGIVSSTVMLPRGRPRGRASHPRRISTPQRDDSARGYYATLT